MPVPPHSDQSYLFLVPRFVAEDGPWRFRCLHAERHPARAARGHSSTGLFRFHQFWMSRERALLGWLANDCSCERENLKLDSHTLPLG